MEVSAIRKFIEQSPLGEAAWPWLMAILVLAIGYVIGRLLARLGAGLARRSGSEHLSSILRRMIFYAVLVFAFFAALGQFGIDFSALLTTAGLLTVAIGFAAQTSVANVISGVFLIIDRPFSINDTVKVDTTVGVVTAIDLLSTKVRTFDNLVVRFPNEAMLKATIVNYSLHTVRRIEQTISVAYDTDLERAVEVIRDCLHAHPSILDEPQPFVLVDLLADSGVTIIVRAWCVRAEFVQAKSDLTMAIKRAVQEAGIEIPFPQRVVHQAPPSEANSATP